MQQNDLKTQIRDAEALHAKATKAELARRYDQAYEGYVRAAELYLHLTRSCDLERDKAKCKASLQRVLDRAEKIKAFTEAARKQATADPGTVSTTPRLTPVSINHFAPHEQFLVLKKGEVVDGNVFHVWSASTTLSSPPHQLYTDPDGQPKLSQEQLAVSPIWTRPSRPKYDVRDIHAPLILPEDIRQHIVTDCSVCASLSVCLEHGRRFGSKLVESPMRHLRNGKGELNEARIALIQQSGRIDTQFLLNGAWRKVVIDDKLPRNPMDGSLMCMSISSKSKSPCTIWPSLLEKAYMKLMGGYDFPGSNSSIDLHAIAGWIPEHVEIRGSDFERERTWQRILNGFTSGQCMVTVGTGPRPVSFDPNLKLIPSHSYAVLDVFETDGERMFTILDSWVHDELQEKDDQSRKAHISWSDALSMFDGIYLSWDPSIWENQITFHGMWKRQNAEDVSKQLFVTFKHASDEDFEEIWVLLTRHVAETRRTQDFISLKVQEEEDVSGAIAFNQQTKCNKETYTNSSHVLTRTRLRSNDYAGIISLLASYDGDAKEVGFTLTVLARKGVDIKWDEHNVATPTYTEKIEGSFTLKTAGGNCTHPTFMVNPQYRLTVLPAISRMSVGNSPLNGATTSRKDGQLCFTVQAARELPVNIAVVRAKEGEERVTELREREIIATSGPYTYGLAKVSARVPVGDVIIVVSSFDPETTGRFTLKVESMDTPFDVKPVPQEGAGMYCKTVSGAWDDTTAGGPPTSTRFFRNPKIAVNVPLVTQFKARLQLAGSAKSIPLSLALYSDTGISTSRSPLHKLVATSGAYSDALAGVATPVVALQPGKYWIVPSTSREGLHAEFRLVIWHSASGVKVGG